jgi:hypothetical protein
MRPCLDPRWASGVWRWITTSDAPVRCVEGMSACSSREALKGAVLPDKQVRRLRWAAGPASFSSRLTARVDMVVRSRWA